MNDLKEMQQAVVMGALLKKLMDEKRVVIEMESESDKQIMLSFDISEKKGKFFGKLYMDKGWYDDFKKYFRIGGQSGKNEQEKEDIRT